MKVTSVRFGLTQAFSCFGGMCVVLFLDAVAAMHLHYGDMTDSTCLVKIVKEIQPTEVYNLAAQSHVKVSWGVYD